MMRVARILIVLAALSGVPAIAFAMQPQPPKEFVPAESIPSEEQIPAVNLVAAAYGFVWIAMLVYVISLARRLNTVETELADLESRRR